MIDLEQAIIDKDISWLQEFLSETLSEVQKYRWLAMMCVNAKQIANYNKIADLLLKDTYFISESINNILDNND